MRAVSDSGGAGGQGGLNLPLPVPFNPGSRPVFFGSRPFALFRLRNIAQCCVIFPFFSRFSPPWESRFPPPLLPPPVHPPPPFLPVSRPPVPPRILSILGLTHTRSEEKDQSRVVWRSIPSQKAPLLNNFFIRLLVKSRVQ